MTTRHESESFWVGRLAAAIDTAIRRPEIARSHLKTTLQQFRGSPVCTPELRDHLNGRETR